MWHEHGPDGLVWCSMSRQTDGPLIIAVLLLAITGLIGSVVDVIHDREAEEWGTHCATLDAIAVQTPEGLRALCGKLAAAFPEFAWTFPVRTAITEDDDGEPWTYEADVIGVELRDDAGENT